MIITLLSIVLLLWLTVKFAGVLLTAAVWLFIKLPCSLIVASFGLACCALIILIPLGIACFKTAAKILF